MLTIMMAKHDMLAEMESDGAIRFLNSKLLDLFRSTISELFTNRAERVSEITILDEIASIDRPDGLSVGMIRYLDSKFAQAAVEVIEKPTEQVLLSVSQFTEYGTSVSVNTATSNGEITFVFTEYESDDDDISPWINLKVLVPADNPLAAPIVLFDLDFYESTVFMKDLYFKCDELLNQGFKIEGNMWCSDELLTSSVKSISMELLNCSLKDPDTFHNQSLINHIYSSLPSDFDGWLNLSDLTLDQINNFLSVGLAKHISSPKGSTFDQNGEVSCFDYPDCLVRSLVDAGLDKCPDSISLRALTIALCMGFQGRKIEAEKLKSRIEFLLSEVHENDQMIDRSGFTVRDLLLDIASYTKG